MLAGVNISGNVQILELSGIGDKDVLDNFNIDTKLHIPGVGNNIQDHIHAISTFGRRIPSTYIVQEMLNLYLCLSEVREERQDDILTFDCLRDPTELANQMQLL